MTLTNNTAIAVTAAHAVTAVGHDAIMTSASVNAGITRLVKSAAYQDSQGRPVTTAPITGLFDSMADAPLRMTRIAALGLEKMLTAYFEHEMSRSGRIDLFLGAAPGARPGPAYAAHAQTRLVAVLKKFTGDVAVEIIPQGNAAAFAGLSRACEAIAARQHALSIVGALDSLLYSSTLNWFEQNRRLKSESPGRHQALVPGQGAGFFICESVDQARRRQKPILAEVKGVGLAVEPEPFITPTPGKAQGLTQAMRAALKTVAPEDIHTLLCDQNGEHHRAREWHFALMRCFQPGGPGKIPFLYPAQCYGDIGAAAGAVLTAIAIEGLRHGRFKEYVLIACADDHGSCGAVVLGK